MVNNAGILRDGIFHKMSEDDWLSVISVHLNGSFFVSRAAAEHYRKQESGSFVHITSTSGLIGNVGQANYAAAKLGITALSKSIALDMATVQCAVELPVAVGLEPDDQLDSDDHLGTTGGGRETAEDDPGQECPAGGFLSSEAAAGVTGQVFGTRMNEIYLFSSSRPIRIVHRAEGGPPKRSPNTPHRH